jgi:predicted TIM-barrel fold metal-dependent hydrolase
LVTTHPVVCAHFFGQILEAFGSDHVLWGTDSIWYGHTAMANRGVSTVSDA